jgi:hypothetical protein
MSELFLVPLFRDEANAFVDQFHRHHGPVVGHLFAIGAAKMGTIVGVAIVGRPVAQASQDGFTAEVRRLATDGTKNACSFLYAACWRAARAMGYRRLVTYTLKSESGVSLVASGWTLIGECGGGSWNSENRPRTDKHPLQRKLRWEVGLKV